MNKNKLSLKKSLSVLLAFVFIAVPLTACGGNGKGTEGLSEYVYVPTYTSLPSEVIDMGNAYLSRGMIYFTASLPYHADGTRATQEEVDAMNGSSSPTDIVTYSASSSAKVAAESSVIAPAPANPVVSDITYKIAIFTINKDGTNLQQLKDFVPTETDSSKQIYSSVDRLIADAQGNVWVAESVSQTIFDLPEGFDPSTQDPWQYYVRDERQIFIRKLSSTGAELARVDISQYAEPSTGNDNYSGQIYVNNMLPDAAGNIYISDGNNTVYVLGADASFLFKVSVENWLSGMVLLKDGSIAVTTNTQDGKTSLKVIDINTKAWGKEYPLASNIWNTSSGGDNYDFCYTDSSSLYGYNLATSTGEKILTWINCDVDSDNISFSTVMKNGDVFAISRIYSDSGVSTFEVINLAKTKRSDVKQKTTLTMATMWMDYTLKKQLLDFNKTNPDYRIEIIDYSEFNTNEDYTAGITKLNTEMIAGNIPDLIDISQLPYKQYAAKGLLEDLYPYIDSDPNLAKEDFMPGIIKAMESDGKLYQLVTSFSVTSIVGAPSVVGTTTGWTMDEMQQIIKDHPDADYPFGMYMTRDSILQALCMLNMDNFMNWQTGVCTFNSDDFKKLLTFANSFPQSVDQPQDGSEYVDSGTLIQDGRQLFEIFSSGDFQNYQYYKAMFGGAITFKGFPSDTESGNVAQIGSGLAMTTACKDKAGAWAFMSKLVSLSSQEQLNWNYPILQKAFDKKLADAMKQEYTTDENGNKIPVSRGGMSIGNGPVIEFYAITQEEANQIKELINSVDHTAVYDQKLLNIINEEAAYYFAGEKTVDQAADIIQSRMTIYVNEQR